MRRFMSRVALLGVVCAAALAIAACGDDDTGGAKSPLDEALGYLGKDAPLAVSIDTDLEDDQYARLGDILEKFPFGKSLIESVKDSIEEQGDFDDIEPLLGNPFVVGSDSAGSLAAGSDSDDFVGAIQTSSAKRLRDAVKRENSKPDGAIGAARLYKDDDGDPFAVKDDVLVVAGSRQQLKRALRQREADNRLTEDAFDDGTDDLPKEALVRVFGHLQRLLAADPSMRDARKVKWVKALRTFGATVSFKQDEADVDFRVDTDEGALSDEDLPFAAGSAAPPVIDRRGEVVIGLRDATQIVDFAEGAARDIDPKDYADFATAKRLIEKRLDISIEDDILKRLEGNLAISLAVDGKYGVRAPLKDPDRFDATLSKLGAVLPDIAEGIAGEPVTYVRPKRGGDFHALATADGRGIVFGVLDGVFVLANDPKIASRLSKAFPKAVPGANGSVAVSADAEQLGRQLLGQVEGLGGLLGGALFTPPLKELTGSMRAAEDGVAGSFKLTFD